MVPTPTPAPPMPMQAMPAPIIFAACGSMVELLSVQSGMGALVARVNRIVEVDAGEDGKDIGLQDCDQQFQRGERDGESERYNCPEPAEETERPQHGHEAPEHLERDMAGKHVGEQPYAVRDRPRQEGHYLDERHQGQNVDGNAAWDEQLHEVQ